MRLFRPFFAGRFLYPEAIFRMKTTERVVWLTFDDGPDPHSTLTLLDLLDSCLVKAIFFCRGMAAEKYPDLISEIKARGHLVGNHGYSHRDGWRCSTGEYLADVSRAASLTSDSLFRPPYGRLRINQYKQLIRNYRIMLWDLMPYDFDRRFSQEDTLQILKKKIRPGSVIVLHDNENSMANNILVDFIKFAKEEGYRFENLLPSFNP